MGDDTISAFAPFVDALSVGQGTVRVEEPRTTGIATVMARAGQTAAFVDRAAALYGVAPEDDPRRVSANGVAFAGTGPGAWLMLREDATPDWAAGAATALDGVASLIDQSSGYALLRLSGEDAARLLQAGLFVDLHPAAFPSGSVAVSVIAHIGVILWRLDGEDGFEIAIFRSFASSFWHWLTTAASAMDIALYRSA